MKDGILEDEGSWFGVATCVGRLTAEVSIVMVGARCLRAGLAGDVESLGFEYPLHPPSLWRLRFPDRDWSVGSSIVAEILHRMKRDKRSMSTAPQPVSML